MKNCHNNLSFAERIFLWTSSARFPLASLCWPFGLTASVGSTFFPPEVPLSSMMFNLYNNEDNVPLS